MPVYRDTGTSLFIPESPYFTQLYSMLQGPYSYLSFVLQTDAQGCSHDGAPPSYPILAAVVAYLVSSYGRREIAY